MAFLDEFRATVVPALRVTARAQAFFVALDLIEWEDARATIREQARKSGAGLLSPDEQERLYGWITETLWGEHAAAEARIAAISERIDNAISADPVRYYAGLAARTSDPDHFQWVFAAVCPEYRAYLIAARDAR